MVRKNFVFFILLLFTAISRTHAGGSTISSDSELDKSFEAQKFWICNYLLEEPTELSPKELENTTRNNTSKIKSSKRKGKAKKPRGKQQQQQLEKAKRRMRAEQEQQEAKRLDAAARKAQEKISVELKGGQNGSTSATTLPTQNGPSTTKKNKSNNKKNKKIILKPTEKRDEFDDPELQLLIAKIEQDRIKFNESHAHQTTEKQKTTENIQELRQKLRDAIFLKKYDRLPKGIRQQLADYNDDGSSDYSDYSDDLNEQQTAPTKIETGIITIVAPDSAMDYLQISYEIPTNLPDDLQLRIPSSIPYTPENSGPIEFIYDGLVFEDGEKNIFIKKYKNIDGDEEKIVRLIDAMPHYKE